MECSDTLVRCIFRNLDETSNDTCITFHLLTNQSCIGGNEPRDINAGTRTNENEWIWLFYVSNREYLLFKLCQCRVNELAIIMQEDLESYHTFPMPVLSAEQAVTINLNWENDYVSNIISIDEIINENEELFERLPVLTSDYDIDETKASPEPNKDQLVLDAAHEKPFKVSPKFRLKITTESLDSICGSSSEVEEIMSHQNANKNVHLLPSKHDSSDPVSSSSDRVLSDPAMKVAELNEEDEVFACKETEDGLIDIDKLLLGMSMDAADQNVEHMKLNVSTTEPVKIRTNVIVSKIQSLFGFGFRPKYTLSENKTTDESIEHEENVLPEHLDVHVLNTNNPTEISGEYNDNDKDTVIQNIEETTDIEKLESVKAMHDVQSKDIFDTKNSIEDCRESSSISVKVETKNIADEEYSRDFTVKSNIDISSNKQAMNENLLTDTGNDSIESDKFSVLNNESEDGQRNINENNHTIHSIHNSSIPALPLLDEDDIFACKETEDGLIDIDKLLLGMASDSSDQTTEHVTVHAATPDHIKPRPNVIVAKIQALFGFGFRPTHSNEPGENVDSMEANVETSTSNREEKISESDTLDTEEFFEKIEYKHETSAKNELECKDNVIGVTDKSVCKKDEQFNKDYVTCFESDKETDQQNKTEYFIDNSKMSESIVNSSVETKIDLISENDEEVTNLNSVKSANTAIDLHLINEPSKYSNKNYKLNEIKLEVQETAVNLQDDIIIESCNSINDEQIFFMLENEGIKVDNLAMVSDMDESNDLFTCHKTDEYDKDTSFVENLEASDSKTFEIDHVDILNVVAPNKSEVEDTTKENYSKLDNNYSTLNEELNEIVINLIDDIIFESSLAMKEEDAIFISCTEEIQMENNNCNNFARNNFENECDHLFVGEKSTELKANLLSDNYKGVADRLVIGDSISINSNADDLLDCIVTNENFIDNTERESCQTSCNITSNNELQETVIVLSEDITFENCDPLIEENMLTTTDDDETKVYSDQLITVNNVTSNSETNATISYALKEPFIQININEPNVDIHLVCTQPIKCEQNNRVNEINQSDDASSTSNYSRSQVNINTESDLETDFKTRLNTRNEHSNEFIQLDENIDKSKIDFVKKIDNTIETNFSSGIKFKKDVSEECSKPTTKIEDYYFIHHGIISENAEKQSNYTEKPFEADNATKKLMDEFIPCIDNKVTERPKLSQNNQDIESLSNYPHTRSLDPDSNESSIVTSLSKESLEYILNDTIGETLTEPPNFDDKLPLSVLALPHLMSSKEDFVGDESEQFDTVVEILQTSQTETVLRAEDQYKPSESTNDILFTKNHEDNNSKFNSIFFSADKRDDDFYENSLLQQDSCNSNILINNEYINNKFLSVDTSISSTIDSAVICEFDSQTGIGTLEFNDSYNELYSIQPMTTSQTADSLFLSAISSTKPTPCDDDNNDICTRLNSVDTMHIDDSYEQLKSGGFGHKLDNSQYHCSYPIPTTANVKQRSEFNDESELVKEMRIETGIIGRVDSLNDDDLFPDSVTPTKADSKLRVEGSVYDFPYIDDDPYCYADNESNVRYQIDRTLLKIMLADCDECTLSSELEIDQLTRQEIVTPNFIKKSRRSFKLFRCCSCLSKNNR